MYNIYIYIYYIAYDMNKGSGCIKEEIILPLIWRTSNACFEFVRTLLWATENLSLFRRGLDLLVRAGPERSGGSSVTYVHLRKQCTLLQE